MGDAPQISKNEEKRGIHEKREKSGKLDAVRLNRPLTYTFNWKLAVFL